MSSRVTLVRNRLKQKTVQPNKEHDQNILHRAAVLHLTKSKRQMGWFRSYWVRQFDKNDCKNLFLVFDGKWQDLCQYQKYHGSQSLIWGICRQDLDASVAYCTLFLFYPIISKEKANYSFFFFFSSFRIRSNMSSVLVCCSELSLNQSLINSFFLGEPMYFTSVI